MSQHSELSESEDYVPLKELRNESMTSLNRKLIKQQSSSYKFFEWQPWLIAVWLCHFIVSLLFITFCSISNHGER